MDEDADYLMALKLQQEFDMEMTPPETADLKVIERKDKFQKRRRSYDNNEDLNSTSNLVHPQWETLDPTPDSHSLFQAFDNKFFQGRLKCVTLEWSKRMYSCAGICYSRRNRLGMAITIRLSEPLLKLRPRKDLIETLLHEMIHAYCSVLGIHEGNGGHGPNFRKIMNGINKVAGTNITVYHTFHDEVDIYKTHWWRCNGICQNRKPFLGYVKRTSNRAPGPNDIWWSQHLASCGGTFMKIKEPEKKIKVKKVEKESTKNNKTVTSPGKDLRNYFPVQNKVQTNNNIPKGPFKGNGGGTLLLNPKTNTSTIPPPSRTSTPTKSSANLKNTGNLSNVVSLKDIENPTSQSTSNTNQFTNGSGYSLANVNTINLTSNENSRDVDREKLRNIWAKRFSSATSTTTSSNPNEKSETKTTPPPDSVILEDSPEKEAGPSKKRRLSSDDQNLFSVDDVSIDWAVVDDEIMIRNEKNSVIEISSDEDFNEDVEIKHEKKPSIKQSSDERQKEIKQEIIDSSDTELNEDDIELIDDDYDDNQVLNTSELADTSLIDDLFGDDTLLKDFKKQNSVIASHSRYHNDPKNDIITCPICQINLAREFFSEHLDGCIGITVKVQPPRSKTFPIHKKQTKKKVKSDKAVESLKNAGYTETDLEGILNSSNENNASTSSSEGVIRREGLNTSAHFCPVCTEEVDINEINEHLDHCLKKKS